MTETKLEAQPELQIDNAQVRVTKWTFAPGASTGWHRHEHDYVVVPLTDGQLKLITPDGEMIADVKKGASYTRILGTEHDVININDHEFAFVEVEMKQEATDEA